MKDLRDILSLADRITVNTQSSIRIEDGGKVLYFDPIEIGGHPQDADVIFVTHPHGDHFSPAAIAKICKADTVLVVPASMADKAKEEILSLNDEALAACRLGYRCRYVRAAAAEVAEGRLNLNRLTEASEPDTIKALTAVCGVGVKVANCVSLFGLHHIDAFPIDVWIRRILQNEYPAGYPKEKYSPYNGIYQQYMFYYYRAKHGKE